VSILPEHTLGGGLFAWIRWAKTVKPRHWPCSPKPISSVSLS